MIENMLATPGSHRDARSSPSIAERERYLNRKSCEGVRGGPLEA